MTVSEPSRSGRAAAASSETTPPYECPTRWSPGSSRSATSCRVRLEVDSSRPADSAGSRAGRATMSSNRSASGRCAAQVARPSDDAAVDEHEPLHRPIVSPLSRSRRDFLQPKRDRAVTSTLICSGRDDAGRGTLASLARHRLGAPAGRACRCDGAGRARRLGRRLGWRSASSSERVVGIPLGVLVVYQVYGRGQTAMSSGIFSTPRPLPSRLGPTLAGGTIIALALPIFARRRLAARRAGRSPPSSGSHREIFAAGTGAPSGQPR